MRIASPVTGSKLINLLGTLTMIDLQTLPADEAERIAYAEGFTGTAALFAQIAELEAQVESLQNAIDNCPRCHGMDQ